MRFDSSMVYDSTSDQSGTADDVTKRNSSKIPNLKNHRELELAMPSESVSGDDDGIVE